jgi:hypothetical protein
MPATALDASKGIGALHPNPRLKKLKPVFSFFFSGSLMANLLIDPTPLWLD